MNILRCIFSFLGFKCNKTINVSVNLRDKTISAKFKKKDDGAWQQVD